MARRASAKLSALDDPASPPSTGLRSRSPPPFGGRDRVGGSDDAVLVEDAGAWFRPTSGTHAAHPGAAGDRVGGSDDSPRVEAAVLTILAIASPGDDPWRSRLS